MLAHLSDASKEGKRHPRASSLLALTEDGQDIHLYRRTPHPSPLDLGNTVHTGSIRRHSSPSKP